MESDAEYARMLQEQDDQEMNEYNMMHGDISDGGGDDSDEDFKPTKKTKSKSKAKAKGKAKSKRSNKGTSKANKGRGKGRGKQKKDESNESNEKNENNRNNENNESDTNANSKSTKAESKEIIMDKENNQLSSNASQSKTNRKRKRMDDNDEKNENESNERNETNNGNGESGSNNNENNNNQTEEEEEPPAKRRRTTKTTKSRKKSSKSPKSPKSKSKGKGKASSKSKSNSGTSPSSKDKDKDNKGRKKADKWSEEEEEKFISGLELYGRDWKSIIKHMGTARDAPAIRSKAQRYFVKLLKEEKELPAKVKESGDGYTLSGNPLNIHSALCIQFFKDPSKVPTHLGGVTSDPDAAKKLKRNNNNNNNGDNNENKNCTSKKKEKNEASDKKKGKKDKKKKMYNDSDSDDCFDANVGEITYNGGELRRSTRQRTTRRQKEQDRMANEDQYELRFDIEKYVLKSKNDNNNKTDSNSTENKSNDNSNSENASTNNNNNNNNSNNNSNGDNSGKDKIKSKSSKSKFDDMIQPFEILACPNALLVADLHGHLCRNVEIMGYLGGYYDKENSKVYILKCYPLREEEQTGKSVTANAMEIFNACQEMKNDYCTINGEKHELSLLGWYHSHPEFENYPSNQDLLTHSHQKQNNLGNDDCDSPFVGLILQSWSSFGTNCEYRWFNAIKDESHSFIPMQFEWERFEYTNINDLNLLKQFENLILRYGESEYNSKRSDLGTIWKTTWIQVEKTKESNDLNSSEEEDIDLTVNDKTMEKEKEKGKDKANDNENEKDKEKEKEKEKGKGKEEDSTRFETVPCKVERFEKIIESLKYHMMANVKVNGNEIDFSNHFINYIKGLFYQNSKIWWKAKDDKISQQDVEMVNKFNGVNKIVDWVNKNTSIVAAPPKVDNKEKENEKEKEKEGKELENDTIDETINHVNDMTLNAKTMENESGVNGNDCKDFEEKEQENDKNEKAHPARIDNNSNNIALKSST